MEQELINILNYVSEEEQEKDIIDITDALQKAIDDAKNKPLQP